MYNFIHTAPFSVFMHCHVHVMQSKHCGFKWLISFGESVDIFITLSVLLKNSEVKKVFLCP